MKKFKVTSLKIEEGQMMILDRYIAEHGLIKNRFIIETIMEKIGNTKEKVIPKIEKEVIPIKEEADSIEENQVIPKSTQERIKERVAKKKKMEEIRLTLEANCNNFVKVKRLMEIDLDKAQDFALDYANGNDIPSEYVDVTKVEYQNVIIEGFKLLLNDNG